MDIEAQSEQAYRYHIRVEGMLDQGWENWLDGFALITRDDGLTLLTGEVQDQSELHGILGRLHSLGLKLQLVALAGCPCSSARCSHRSSCRECVEHEMGRGGSPVCMRVKSKWEMQVSKVISN